MTEKPQSAPANDLNALGKVFRDLQASPEQGDIALRRFLAHRPKEKRSYWWPSAALVGALGLVVVLLLWPNSVTMTRDTQSPSFSRFSLNSNRIRHQIEAPNMSRLSVSAALRPALPPRPSTSSALALSRLTQLDEV